MANDNMKFWESVKKTDPKQVKAITGKQYTGNSPKPYYLVERMTECFGMCGIGWGLNILNERMERLSDTDVLHVAMVELWYVHEGKKGTITQIGQTKACYKTSKGGLLVDEDAPKKSVTDAMTKCMSYLGFAGDIFSGRWDDSKYVQELKNEFSDEAGHPDGKGDVPPPRPDVKPMTDDEVAACIVAMSDITDIGALKGVFGGAYRRADATQKQALTNAYNIQKSTLEKAA